MAFVDEQKQQDPNQQQTQGQQAQTSVGNGQQGSQGAQPQQTAAPAVGNSGSSDVGSGVSTAGVGAGGQGGWTNIQSYLSANKDDNSGANALTNQVGSQFDKSQGDIQSSAANTKSQADTAVQNNNLSPNQISQMLGGYYGADDKGNQTPNAATKNQFSQALQGSYGGPTTYGYGLDGRTQDYGNALSTDQGFNGLMGQLYNNAAGGQMNEGQLALQNQLDTNNQNVANARSGLSARYKALQDMAGQSVADTNNAIQGDMTQWGQNQQNLNTNLTNQAADDKTWLDNYYANQANPQGGGVYVGPMVRGPGSKLSEYNAINDALGVGTQYQVPTGPAPAPAANPFTNWHYAPSGTPGAPNYDPTLDPSSASYDPTKDPNNPLYGSSSNPNDGNGEGG